MRQNSDPGRQAKNSWSFGRSERRLRRRQRLAVRTVLRAPRPPHPAGRAVAAGLRPSWFDRF